MSSECIPTLGQRAESKRIQDRVGHDSGVDTLDESISDLDTAVAMLVLLARSAYCIRFAMLRYPSLACTIETLYKIAFIYPDGK